MIESVELVNFISHKDTTIPLEDGVNVFIGANGAGKSSVVDAITYALYGEHTRDSARNILRRGAAGGSASVKFNIGSREYLAERRFGKGAKLESATLRELAPNPRLIVAGERRQYDESMSDEVSKAFGLDYERMKVAAIIQQGELDAIIRYKPKELKELLNSLIGIDRLDVAFQNMRDALGGFRLRLRAECMNYDDQSLEGFAEEIRSTKQKEQDAEAQVTEISTRLSKLELDRVRLEAALARMEPLRSRKNELEERTADLIKYVRKRVSELEGEVSDLGETVGNAKTYLPVLSSKESVELEGSALEEEERKLVQARTDLTSDLRSARTAAERVKRLEGEIKESVNEIKKLTVKVQGRNVEIKKLKSVTVPTQETAEQLGRGLKQVERVLDDFKENMTKISVVIANYRTIQTKGICPTCESTVEEINLDAKLAAKHKQHIEARSKYDLALQQRDSTKVLLEKRKDYDSAQTRLEEQKGLLKEYSSDLKGERKKLAAARKELKVKSAEARGESDLASRLESVQSKTSNLVGKKHTLQKKQSSIVEAETWLRQNRIGNNADIEQLDKKLRDLQKKVRSVPKSLTSSDVKAMAVDDYASELVNKVIELEKEASMFDETSYQSSKKDYEGRIRPAIAKTTSDLGGWKKQGSEARERLAKLNEVQTKLEEARRYVALFEKIRNEIYNRDGVLATSLRSWALKELSRNASDYVRSFGIGLSELQLKEQKHDVIIECYSSSGMADLKSMSGGEGVAIALALRFAMAKLMGKGMVDFIVLDEPTTHLDEGRRRSLVRLITEFNSDEKRTSLNQIIVITHDREIFEDSEVNAVFQFEKTSEGTTVTKS
jgi:exonuclease SbcC